MVKHIKLIDNQGKMTTLTLWIVLFSLVALGQQNYIQLFNPYGYWLENDNWNYQSADTQVQNRSPNSMYRPTSNVMYRHRPIYIQPEQRLFFGQISNVLSSLLGGSSSSSLTPSSSYIFSASTPTSTLTSFCTEAAAFAATTACVVRRRRGIAVEEFNDQVQPTAVLTMASPSVGPTENDISKREVAIVSSKDEETSQILTASDLEGRFFGILSGQQSSSKPSVVTVTVTTLASPVLSTLLKTVSSAVVNADPAQLPCLPPGGVVC